MNQRSAMYFGGLITALVLWTMTMLLLPCLLDQAVNHSYLLQEQRLDRVYHAQRHERFWNANSTMPVKERMAEVGRMEKRYDELEQSMGKEAARASEENVWGK